MDQPISDEVNHEDQIPGLILRCSYVLELKTSSSHKFLNHILEFVGGKIVGKPTYGQDFVCKTKFDFHLFARLHDNWSFFIEFFGDQETQDKILQEKILFAIFVY